MNCDSSLQGTKPGPVTQRLNVVVASRPSESFALSTTLCTPPPAGVSVQVGAVAAVTTVHVVTVSVTHSPIICAMPSRSRRTRCHSRRINRAVTRTPDSSVPSGRIARTLIRCASPARQNQLSPASFAPT